MLILSVVPASGPQPALNEWVRGVAAALCALCGVGFLTYRLRSAAPPGANRQPARVGPAAVTGLLSLAVVLLLMLVPVYLLAARTHAPSEQWIGYGFFDKRWVVALFTLGTLGVLLVVTVVSQLVRAADASPESWRGWMRIAFGSALGDAPIPGPGSIASRAGCGIGAGVLWRPTSSPRPGTWR